MPREPSANGTSARRAAARYGHDSIWQPSARIPEDEVVDTRHPEGQDIVLRLNSYELRAMLNCVGLVVEKLDDSDFHPIIGADRDEVEALCARLRSLRDS